MTKPAPTPPKARPLTAADLAARLRAAANPAQAKTLQSFFKTGPGQYAAGDIFIGIKVPVTRKHVREFRHLSPEEALPLVHSKVHEERLAGLLLWVQAFERGDRKTRERIFRLYCEHRQHINTWDLVDVTAPNIVGGFLHPGDIALLERWAESTVLWERRIAVVATFAFIRRGVFGPTLRLCRQLLRDRHDLMHKACGWMLREMGKRDRAVLTRFLERHAGVMPRTMLRYALEHYPAAERTRFMRYRNTRAVASSG